jgi:hypothetical protein
MTSDYTSRRAGWSPKAAGSYRVCWWFKTRTAPTCRNLSAAMHRSPREAAETVLMQNPSAIVNVIPPRGGPGGLYVYSRKAHKAVPYRGRGL